MQNRIITLAGNSVRLRYEQIGRTMVIQFETLPSASDISHFLQRTEVILRNDFNFDDLILTGIPRRYEKILNGCRMYGWGRNYRKIMDPVYRSVSANAFDAYGYIIDQNCFSSVPFGFFSSSEKGCGWIAAWNMLRFCNDEKTIGDVIHSLEKGSLSGKINGQMFLQLYMYLKKELPVHFCISFQDELIRKSSKCRCGILLYTHRTGNHYVFFTKEGEDSFHFRNAVYGRRYHIATMEKFLETFSILPFAHLIWTDEVCCHK